jgi:diguanylate cyclase (GGDEF)-like protein
MRNHVTPAARRTLRRHLSRGLSVLLVLLIGALGLLATRSAGHRAIEVHREDRVQLERLLATLTTQASAGSLSALKGLLDGQELAGAPRFSAAPGTDRAAEDVRRLRAVLDKSPNFDAGAVVVNVTGEPVAQWSPTGKRPDRTDPGFQPLIAAVTTGMGSQLPLSGVLDAGGVPVAAVGAPVTLADGSPGLFVGYYDLRSGVGQKFTENISRKHGVDGFVIDHRGLAMSAPDPSLVGEPVPMPAMLAQLPATGYGLLDTTEAGQEWVTAYASVDAMSWRVAAAEPRESFQGELEAGSRRAQVAVLLLLLLAGGGMLGMHRRRESALQEVAHTDELTGLLNRRGWFEEAEQELQRSARAGQQRMLLFVDLDGLKQVNDVLGHREGDRAIADAAAVLRRAADPGDVIGRLGGDEFVVLTAAGTAAPAHKVLSTLAAHNESSGAGFELCFSLGLERWDPADPCSLEELVRRADAVMYVDKTGRPDRRQGVLRLPVQRPGDELVSPSPLDAGR